MLDIRHLRPRARMSPLRVLAGMVCLVAFVHASSQTAPKPPSTLRARVESSPLLPFHPEPLAAQPPAAGWASGTVSWVTVAPDGTIYEIQRGDQADPVLVLDKQGKVLRSWGKGDFSLPHAIRLDPAGNVWTVDANSSTVIEYTPLGKKLLTIVVGEQPQGNNAFVGTTDIAFAPNGHLYITDGYGNARVLEYTPDGKRVREWGTHGTGTGEFHLPHAIQIDKDGTIYVADRENGRIQKFDLQGNFLGEITDVGRVFSLRLVGGMLWATTQPLDQPLTVARWIVKIDARSGKIVGHLDVPPTGGHCVEVTPAGEPVTTFGTQLLWFKAN
jgi:DNA-binding beta-propeller fold protein YncE